MLLARVGRGAMGFTTRSDIGPARSTGTAGIVASDGIQISINGSIFQSPLFGQALAGYVARRGKGELSL
jgi:hypothetical protein